MDAGDRPTPPDDLDAELQAFLMALGDEDVETIRAVEQYVDALASWAERNAVDGRDTTAVEESAGSPTDGDLPRPEGVSDDATVSVTEIADTVYYYYQWRDGDTIRSETVTRDTDD